MANQSKHVILTLQERNGERTYTDTSVHILNVKRNINKWAEEYASTFLNGKSDKEDGGYYFSFGQFHISVVSVKEISEEDFNILQKYL